MKELDYTVFLNIKNGIERMLEDGWYYINIPSDQIKCHVKNHFLHTDNDEPTIIRKESKHWYKEGKLHRENGPASIYNYGKEKWYIEGRLHRKDGPAEISDSQEKWFKNGRVYRKDGPAVINKFKENQYVVHNFIMSKEVFDSLPRNQEGEIHSLEPIVFKNIDDVTTTIYVLDGNLNSKEMFDKFILKNLLQEKDKQKNIKI